MLSNKNTINNMSELLHTPRIVEDKVFEFCCRLIDGENGKMLIESYKTYLDNVNPSIVMVVLDRLMTGQYNHAEVKKNVGKIINVFTRPLEAESWEKPNRNHFLSLLMEENRQVEKVIAEVRPAIKSMFKENPADQSKNLAHIRHFIERVRDYELHYIKKENILFPYLEKTFEQHRCISLMWSFQDDFRKGIKSIESVINSEKPDLQRLNRELGELFFVIFPLIFREEKIVFPIAMRAVPPQAWDDMLNQSMDIGWCYGVTPKLKNGVKSENPVMEGMVDLGTGQLNSQQLMLMLNHLPVDITFVDENDRVCYFSGTPHRIFPRTNAIIGRTVQNCHPHESVHMVEKILDSFRRGQKDHADFWIQYRGKFIYIRYFALRNEKGEYKGTIEVSQDATEVRALEGQNRLLNWDETN